MSSKSNIFGGKKTEEETGKLKFKTPKYPILIAGNSIIRYQHLVKDGGAVLLCSNKTSLLYRQ